MRRNAIAVMILTLLLISMLILAFGVPKAKSSAIIRILPDGSVDPPIAPINRAEDFYTLTDNVFASIIIEKGNITIDGNGFTVQGAGAGRGLDLSTKDNVTIKNTIVNGFDAGIYLDHSDNNILSSNIISSNKRHGIRFWFCSNNVFSDNKLTNNTFAVDFNYCSNSSLLANIVQDNYIGIWLSYSSNNFLCGNTFIKNQYGIYNDYSSNNFIHNNNFINNNHQWGYFDRPDKNIWDDGYPSGGNYWSDYNGTDLYSGPDQNNAGSDGIGDAVYIVDKNNQDNYPLMGMFSDFNTSLDYNVDVVSNSTIEDFTLLESSSTIKMHVSNMTANQTYGFCRICIPSTLMSEPYNVIIDGAEPHYVSYTLYNDEDSRYIYFSYEYSHINNSLEMTIIPDFLSFVILSMLIMAILLVAVHRNRASSKRYKCGDREH
jgi:parallel beta-helix repeat protein